MGPINGKWAGGSIAKTGLVTLLVIAAGGVAALANFTPHEARSALKSNNPTDIPLGHATADVLSRSIRVPWDARLSGVASVDLFQSNAGASIAFCQLKVDGENASRLAFADFNHKNDDEQLSLVGGLEVPQGVHKVRVDCTKLDNSGSGAPKYDRGDLTIRAVAKASQPKQIILGLKNTEPPANQNLPSIDTTVVGRRIDTPWRSRIIANASLGLIQVGNGSTTAECHLTVDGSPAGLAANQIAFTGYSDSQGVGLTGGLDVAPGRHVVRALCKNTSPSPPNIHIETNDLEVLAVSTESHREVKSQLASTDPPDLGFELKGRRIEVAGSIQTRWPSLISANASLAFKQVGTGTSQVHCRIEVDSVAAGQNAFADFTGNLEPQQLPVTGGKVIPAGSHRVAAVCFPDATSGSPAPADSYQGGDLTFIAVRR